MTLDEAVELAQNGDLQACKALSDYYINQDKMFDALPYVEILAQSGDDASYGTLALLYSMHGMASKDIFGVASDNALNDSEKELYWANKSGQDDLINRAKQHLGECFYAVAEYKESEEHYIKAYNTLVDTIEINDEKKYDIIWALAADKLIDLGYNVPEEIHVKRVSIYIDALNNRHSLISDNNSKVYVASAIRNLGFACLVGDGTDKDENAAYSVFFILKNDLGIICQHSDTEMDILDKFHRGNDGRYYWT